MGVYCQPGVGGPYLIMITVEVITMINRRLLQATLAAALLAGSVNVVSAAAAPAAPAPEARPALSRRATCYAIACGCAAIAAMAAAGVPVIAAITAAPLCTLLSKTGSPLVCRSSEMDNACSNKLQDCVKALENVSFAIGMRVGTCLRDTVAVLD